MTDIKKAAGYLHNGELVAFPTETVYGLAGNALSDTAVARIYTAKDRPQFNPLIIHVPTFDEVKRYAECNRFAELLAERFWPGPLTLVLRRKKDCTISLLASAGLDTVAMRVPAHPVAQALLRECGFPIAAPSANRSGRISPTTAQHVCEELADKVAMILDGGACEVGLESTVVDVTGDKPVILRPGSITAEMLAKIVGTLGNPGGAIIASPGMLEKHYAPDHPIRLNAIEVEPDEALLAFGSNYPKDACVMENLSEKGDLVEAAANLFRMLRLLDASNARSIAIMPITHEGIGVAINDRLRRAAQQ